MDKATQLTLTAITNRIENLAQQMLSLIAVVKQIETQAYHERQAIRRDIRPLKPRLENLN